MQAVLLGLGGSPSVRTGTHWEGLEGRSLQPEAFSGDARYKYHSEVGLAIQAGCTSPHLSCWGGKPNTSVLLRAFFALLPSAVTSSGELAGQPGAGVCASRRSGWLKASTFCCSGCASAKCAPSLVHGQAQTSFWK